MHTGPARANAARNILGLGLNRLLAGGAPVAGRGGDDEAEAFFPECRVETAGDPSTMPWNDRGSPPGFQKFVKRQINEQEQSWLIVSSVAA